LILALACKHHSLVLSHHIAALKQVSNGCSRSTQTHVPCFEYKTGVIYNCYYQQTQAVSNGCLWTHHVTAEAQLPENKYVERMVPPRDIFGQRGMLKRKK